MLFPLAVAFTAVSAGTWFALGPREGTRLLRVVRWAAFGASLFVVGTHLLPEAMETLGRRALLAFLGGLAFPICLEAGMKVALRAKAHAASERTSLEVGYAGLLAHRFGDGLTMGAAGAAAGSAWASAGTVLAVAAHIVPVTTVMVLAFVEIDGRKAAIPRGTGLAVATMAGVALAALVLGAQEAGAAGHGAHGHGTETPLAAWISATVAGLLVHIVLHDLPRLSSSGDAGKK